MTQLVLTVSSWIDLSVFLDYFKSLKVRYQKYIVYTSTVKELSSLTDKELKDIGVSRGMIHSIAMDHATNSDSKGWI